MTVPEVARVETSLPASKTGRASAMSTGSSRANRRSSSALRSGWAAAHASKASCQRAFSGAVRSARARVRSMTSSGTTKLCSGSQPSTRLVAASSSEPSADPWIFPVFCLPGEGQPMIVFSTMSDGREVSPWAASIAE